MTPDQFKAQCERLRSRFGERAFDNEFVKLVWQVCVGMAHHDFVRIVETFIGSRSHNKPPLLSEFREERLRCEKRVLERDSAGAARVLAHPAFKRSAAEILSKDFGAVDSVKDAFEVARLKLLKKRDDDGGAA